MNCGFDSFEPDTMFFWKSNISLSMSDSAAGSIRKKFNWVQTEATLLAISQM